MTVRILFEPAQELSGEIVTQFHLEKETVNLPVAARVPVNMGALSSVIQQYESGTNPTATVVKDVGSALWSNIARHQNATEAFRDALNGADSAVVRLTFTALGDEARALPWETMYSPHGFLAFGSQVPIIREIPDTGRTAPLAIEAGMPFKLLAVIAAQGGDANSEWRALRRALQAAGGGMPTEVLVLSSSKAVVDDIKSAGTDGIAARKMPGSKQDLVHAIAEFAPHYAHFFCHGEPTGGNLVLENGGAEYGEERSLFLDLVDLKQSLLGTTWIVVLNACSLAGDGADQSGETASLCEKLVQQGLPLVIGMRAPVSESNANRFAEGFTGRALAAIARTLEKPGTTDLNLGRCFAAACRDILADNPQPPNAAAEVFREWSLPVYTTREGFGLIERPPPLPPEAAEMIAEDVLDGDTPRLDTLATLKREELAGELDMLSDLIAKLDSYAPHVIDGIEARIREIKTALTGVPVQMTGHPG
ncbi:CHAT domain-containing protein [Allomesorhizobium alhagi]|uniref:TPR repeat-containing protein n=1 Tax=Mesorhizobium alhagi CCNWXJ12-2 TaxID=1107882 RepID=H0HQ93_9HYPH|nr:CHAT domain-containing protein [Mesorhizobium alhagi]EHK57119.1 TPR repeat-containing protein [Mesorhizobium alhagi CCNWXJ12-2]